MSIATSIYGGCLLPAVLIYIVIKWSLPAQLVAGLQHWTVPSPDAEADALETNSASPSKGRTRTSKHDSQASKAARKEVLFPGSTSLALSRTQARRIPASQHYRALEALVAAWIVVAGTTVVEWLRALAAEAAVSAIPAALSIVGLCIGLWALAEVDLVSAAVPRADKFYIVGLGVLGCLGSAASLTKVPAHILDFDISEAAEELGAASTEFLSAAIPGVEGLQVEVHPGWLTALLAVLGGAITALVASASMRAARCLELAVRTPHFATRYVVTTWPACVLLNATMLLPPLTCLLWVTPLGQDLWQVLDGGVRWARVGVLLALGVLQLLAARLCTQAHLHSALVQWWTHKHAGQAADAGSASRMGTYIKMRADFINVLFCKVAVQVAAPGLLWLALGAMLGLCAFTEGRPAAHGSIMWSSAELINSTFGFLAWWTCCSWTLFSMATLALFRYGFLVT